jgi:SAM-dependent methyltransferase
LEFSNKYHESRFPEQYAAKHRESLGRRLNDHREQALLRRCLAVAAPDDSVADIGCGPGRFWPTIAACGAASLYALDVSHAMLSYARARHLEDEGPSFRLSAGSVLALPFADRAFDCVVAMRLIHHFGGREERRTALGELTRISRRYLVLSLWTDGNYKSWRRARLEARRPPRSYENRHVVSRQALAEDFDAAGLVPVVHFDLVPGYSQWRYYLLERRIP